MLNINQETVTNNIPCCFGCSFMQEPVPTCKQCGMFKDCEKEYSEIKKKKQ